MREIVGVREIARYLGCNSAVISNGWRSGRWPIRENADGRAYSYDLILDAAKPLLFGVHVPGAKWSDPETLESICGVFTCQAHHAFENAGDRRPEYALQRLVVVASELAVCLQLLPGELWYDGPDSVMPSVQFAVDAAFGGLAVARFINLEPYKCRYCSHEHDWTKLLSHCPDIFGLLHAEEWLNDVRGQLRCSDGSDAVPANSRAIGRDFSTWCVELMTRPDSEGFAELLLACKRDDLQGRILAVNQYWWNARTRQLARWASEFERGKRFLPAESKARDHSCFGWLLRKNPGLISGKSMYDLSHEDAGEVWLQACELLEAGELNLGLPRGMVQAIERLRAHR